LKSFKRGPFWYELRNGKKKHLRWCFAQKVARRGKKREKKKRNKTKGSSFGPCRCN